LIIFLLLKILTITSLGYCGRDEFQRNLGKWFHAATATDITQTLSRISGGRKEKKEFCPQN
jgi:hypothetical protein